MAVDLPTTRLTLQDFRFESGRAIVSGALAADQPYGYSGISAQCNHAYAYRTQVLAQEWPDPETGAPYIVDSDSTRTMLGGFGLRDTPSRIPCYFAAGVTTIRLCLWGQNIGIRWFFYDGTNAVISTLTFLGSKTEFNDSLTTIIRTGILGFTQVQYSVLPNTTGIIYGYVIDEQELIAGEIT